LSEPEQRLLDAMIEQEQIRVGEEYFEENWDELVPRHARETILAAASRARTLECPAVSNSLIKANEALERDEPAVAFFHIRRAVEGYVGAVLTRPVFDFLQGSVGTKVALFARPLHSIFRAPFVESLKRLTIEIITDDTVEATKLTTEIRQFFEAQPFRNDIFHSLHEPERTVIADLLAKAQALLNHVDEIVPREVK
jgi:hypothetical protein